MGAVFSVIVKTRSSSVETSPTNVSTDKHSEPCAPVRQKAGVLAPAQAPWGAGRSWSINGVCGNEPASSPKFLLLFISQLLALVFLFNPLVPFPGGIPHTDLTSSTAWLLKLRQNRLPPSMGNLGVCHITVGQELEGRP